MAKDKIRMKLQLVTPPAVIERRIKEAIANTINLAMRSSVKNIRGKIEPVIRDSIKNSFEVDSLLFGDLKAELGVQDAIAHSAIDLIINELIASIQIDVTPMRVFGRTFKAILTVSLFPKDLINRFSNSSEGSYLTTKGQKIPWLKWLLTLGDKIIIRDYDVVYSNSPQSRTGLAIMKKTSRVGWRVPPQYSGTSSNNFITRAIDDAADLIAFHLRTEFAKKL